MSEKLSPEVLEADFEISYPTASLEIFEFVEIVRDSGLEDRCSPELKEELRNILEKHKKIFSSCPGSINLVEHITYYRETVQNQALLNIS